MEFTSDGKYLFHSTIISLNLFNVEQRESIYKSTPYYLTNHAYLAPNQRQIAITGRDNVIVLDSKDGSSFELRAKSVSGQYTPNGDRLFIEKRKDDGWITVFDTYSWNKITEIHVSDFSPFSIVISPDQSKFAIVPNRGNKELNQDNSISMIPVFNLQTYELIHAIKSKFWREIREALFSNDGRYLFTRGDHKFFEKFDMETGERLGDCLMKNPICDLAITPDDCYLFVCENNNIIKILDSSTFELLHTIEVQHEELYNHIAISPDGRYAAAGSSKGSCIDFWNLEQILNPSSNTPTETPSDVPTETQTATPTPWRTPFPTPTNTPTMETAARKFTLGSPGKDDDPGIISKCLFHPDGKRILTFDNKQRLIVWNKHTEKIQRILYSDVKHPALFKLTDEGRHVWVEGQSNGYTLEGWDIESGGKIYSRQWIYDQVSSVDILPDESAYIYGTFQQTTILYDYKDDRVIRRYKNTGDSPYAQYLKVSDQGDRVAVVETNRNNNPRRTQATVWNIQTGETLCTISLDKRIIDNVFWSPDGKYVYLRSWGNRSDGSLDDNYIDQFEAETGDHVFRFVYPDNNHYDLSPDRTRFHRLAAINKRHLAKN